MKYIVWIGVLVLIGLAIILGPYIGDIFWALDRM